MTLRHYGRALAAASGAVLLCATLSVPALATPSSDTGAAAPVAASATDEGSAPITVTVTYTNNTDSTITVFPVDSNLSGVLTPALLTAAGTTSPRTPPSSARPPRTP